MRVGSSAAGLLAAFLFAAPVCAPQSRYGAERGGEDETGPYEVVPNWPQPIPGFEGFRWGSTAGVFAETPNKIFIFQRGLVPPSATQGGPLIQATNLQPRWTLGEAKVPLNDDNLYTAEVFNGRAQKFRPRRGLDPARLVGPPLQQP